jgi:hypothetical protein
MANPVFASGFRNHHSLTPSHPLKPARNIHSLPRQTETLALTHLSGIPHFPQGRFSCSGLPLPSRSPGWNLILAAMPDSARSIAGIPADGAAGQR